MHRSKKELKDYTFTDMVDTILDLARTIDEFANETNRKGRHTIKAASLVFKATEEIRKLEAQEKRQYLGLSRDEFNRFKKACYITEGALADELQHCKTQPELVEMILDADRVLTYGHTNERDPDKRKEFAEFYDKTIHPWLLKNYDTKPFKALMKGIFPRCHN